MRPADTAGDCVQLLQTSENSPDPTSLGHFQRVQVIPSSTGLETAFLKSMDSECVDITNLWISWAHLYTVYVFFVSIPISNRAKPGRAIPCHQHGSQYMKSHWVHLYRPYSGVIMQPGNYVYESWSKGGEGL